MSSTGFEDGERVLRARRARDGARARSSAPASATIGWVASSSLPPTGTAAGGTRPVRAPWRAGPEPPPARRPGGSPPARGGAGPAGARCSGQRSSDSRDRRGGRGRSRRRSAAGVAAGAAGGAAPVRPCVRRDEVGGGADLRLELAEVAAVGGHGDAAEQQQPAGDVDAGRSRRSRSRSSRSKKSDRRKKLPLKLKLNGIAEKPALPTEHRARRRSERVGRGRRRPRPAVGWLGRHVERRGSRPSTAWPRSRSGRAASGRRRRRGRPCPAGRSSCSCRGSWPWPWRSARPAARLVGGGLLLGDLGVERRDLLALGREDEQVERGDRGDHRDRRDQDLGRSRGGPGGRARGSGSLRRPRSRRASAPAAGVAAGVAWLTAFGTGTVDASRRSWPVPARPRQPSARRRPRARRWAACRRCRETLAPARRVAGFSDFESETRVTPSTARRGTSSERRRAGVDAQPASVIAGAWIEPRSGSPPSRAPGRPMSPLRLVSFTSLRHGAGEVAQRLLPVEAGGGEAAHGLDAGVRQRLEVGIRLERGGLLARGRRALVGRRRGRPALLDGCWSHVAARAPRRTGRAHPAPRRRRCPRTFSLRTRGAGLGAAPRRSEGRRLTALM